MRPLPGGLPDCQKFIRQAGRALGKANNLQREVSTLHLPSTTHNYGLVYARNLEQNHGCYVQVSSEEGCRSLFGHVDLRASTPGCIFRGSAAETSPFSVTYRFALPKITPIHNFPGCRVLMHTFPIRNL